jgi:ribosomal protein L7Ae-like RNA K-turn-binding protein
VLTVGLLPSGGATVAGAVTHMDQKLELKLLRLVGLGRRSRGVVVGVERVRDAALRNRLAFAVVAPDVSRHSLEKIVPLLTARRVRWISGPSARALGSAVGRETTAAVGIVDRQLASGICRLVDASSSASS